MSRVFAVIAATANRVIPAAEMQRLFNTRRSVEQSRFNSDLRYFCDGNPVIPAARQILLSYLKTKLGPREQWLLMSLEDLLGVIENRFAVEIGKRHFQFRHPDGFVRNILQRAGDDINPLARKVLACRNTKMRQLQIILNRGRVRDLRQRNAGSIIPG